MESCSIHAGIGKSIKTLALKLEAKNLLGNSRHNLVNNIQKDLIQIQCQF